MHVQCPCLVPTFSLSILQTLEIRLCSYEKVHALYGHMTFRCAQQDTIRQVKRLNR